MTPNLIVSPAIKFPVEAATRIADEINDILKNKSSIRIALSGGNTPRAVNKELVKHDIDWSKVNLYWGDERMVPHTNIDSNYRMNHDSLINCIKQQPMGIYAIPYNKSSEMAAELYDNILHESLGDDLKIDIILLGMGDDGHIASLFPGQKYDDSRFAVASISPKIPANRVSLSLPFIAKAAKIFVMINGNTKAERIADVLNGKSDVPAAKLYRLRPDIIWLLDSAAAHCLTMPG
ncbi:MAG: 6-phosphogluconolactonase [bacterium]